MLLQGHVVPMFVVSLIIDWIRLKSFSSWLELVLIFPVSALPLGILKIQRTRPAFPTLVRRRFLLTGLFDILPAYLAPLAGRKFSALDLAAPDHGGTRWWTSTSAPCSVNVSTYRQGLSTSSRQNIGVVPAGLGGKNKDSFFLVKVIDPGKKCPHQTWAVKLFCGQLVPCGLLHINTYLQTQRFNNSSQTHLSTHSGIKCSQ